MSAMDRRLIIAALASWPAARLLAAEQRPRHKISAGELHKALSARFPVRFGAGRLLAVSIDAPGLLLLPARNRLGATLQAELSGLQVKPMEPGELDVLFALRYEASDRTVRAHRLEVLELRWPGLPAGTHSALQQLLPALAREAVGEVVLHRFSPRELALADTMGFEPEHLDVTHDGLEVRFGPKAR